MHPGSTPRAATLPHPRLKALLISTTTFITGVLVALALTLSLPAISDERSGARASDDAFGSSPLPATQHSAADVVRIVITALRENDPSGGNRGIATVYRFASPGNRQATGPYPRFLAMIHQGFPDMLNHIDSRFDPIEVSGDLAVQTVWLLTRSGEERGYLFQLGRQQEGDFAGMWMTEAVVPVGNRAPRMVI